MDGAGLISKMREENAETRFLVYSGTENPGLFLSAQEAGANGLVHHADLLMDLLRALDAVAHGGTFISPRVSALLRDAKGGNRLNAREQLVVQLVASGLSSKQIAEKISVATKTADHYRTQIMQKLGLRSIAALTRYAVRCGLISVECWMLASLFDG